MDQVSTNWVAILLAILIAGITMISSAGAHNLTLPQTAAEPVALRLAGNARAEARPSELLQIFVGQPDACCEGRTAIAGRYTRTSDGLTFLPAFGFDAGQDYVARVLTTQGAELVSFRLPSEAVSNPAIVTDIYPSGTTLPENTLRFYIHFSAPMSPHVAFDYIKLRDSTGSVDEAAFMRFKQELWNEDRTRLTVLIDPGRIKREVATNVELGPALRVGKTYELTVEGGWPSADGASVLPSFTKAFRVSEALRERPDTSLWTTKAPCAGTREPLTIAFDRPMDRHLLTRALRIEDGAARGVHGTTDIGAGERTWSFTPQRPWTFEDLRLIANPSLEDVAGNNFHDLLDHVADPQEFDPSSTSLLINIRECAS